MAELKTKKNTVSVAKFIAAVPDEQKQKDAAALLKIFQSVTGEKVTMWGTSIIGFGQYHYKCERSSQEGDWPLTGFSPRKQNIALYSLKIFKMTVNGLKEKRKENDFLLKLGKYKEGGGCLYINKISDINTKELEKIIKLAVSRKK